MLRRVLKSLIGFFLVVPIAAAAPLPRIPSEVVEKQVAKLTTQIKWLSSLEEAKEKAQKEKKLIFWLDALGDLDGTC
jgi:hypothetical protein